MFFIRLSIILLFLCWKQVSHKTSSSQHDLLVVDFRNNQVFGSYESKLQFLIRSDFIYIKTENGNRTLVTFYKYDVDVHYLHVLDYSILRYKGEDYHLPWRGPSNTSTQLLRNFIGSKIQNIKTLSHLRFKRLLKIQNRLTHEETHLLVKMSKALAEKFNNELVQRFHWLVKGLVLAVSSPSWKVEGDSSPSQRESKNYTLKDDNVNQGSCKDMRHNNINLSSSKKPDKCFGMCGMICWCWPWVCGDCCLHKGCFQHDTCCKIHGYASIYCFCPWVFGFSCQQGYKGYPDCMY